MKTNKEIIKIIKARIAYGNKYRLKNKEDLRNGWSGIESGKCCKSCRINYKKVLIDDRAVALRCLVGCTNPFQIKEQHGRKLCQCHLSYRKVAEKSIQEELKNILRLTLD